MLLQGTVVTTMELIHYSAAILVLENDSVHNSSLEVFWQSHCLVIVLSCNTFEVSNIYNCNITEVYCLNTYWLFAVLR